MYRMRTRAKSEVVEKKGPQQQSQLVSMGEHSMNNDQSDVVVTEGDKTIGSETGALSPVTTVLPNLPFEELMPILDATDMNDDGELLSAAYQMTIDMGDQSEVGEKCDQTMTGGDTPPVSPAPTLPVTLTDVVDTVQDNEPEASPVCSTPLKRTCSRQVDKEVIDDAQNKKSRKSGLASREETVSPIPTYFGLTDVIWPVDANGFPRNPALPCRVFTLETDRDVEVHVFRRPDIPGVSI